MNIAFLAPEFLPRGAGTYAIELVQVNKMYLEYAYYIDNRLCDVLGCRGTKKTK